MAQGPRGAFGAPWDPPHPKGPKGTQGGKGTQGRAKGPKGTQGGPRGPKGTQGRLRRPWEVGPWGPLGVIPKSFRMESHFEWKVITKGSYSEMKVVAKESRPKANGSKWQQN